MISDGGADDLTFLHGSHTARCVARVDKHFLGYHTLQYLTIGAVELFYGEQRHLVDRPGFWPAFPGPRIRFHPAPGHGFWEHRYIAFRGPLVARWAAAGLLPTRPQPAPRGLEYRADFTALYAAVARPGRWNRLAAINRLEALLIELAAARAQDEPSDPWLAEVLRRIAGAAPPDYPRLARSLGLALSTLRRRFRAATGTALHDYTLQQRLARARELLATTDQPVKAVAERLGYRDVFFFSRQFRAHVGMPPAAFRRSRQV